jgi:hypothetical protein
MISTQFIDIFGNISFIYSFIPPVIRVLFDQEYIERISNGKLRRR